MLAKITERVGWQAPPPRPPGRARRLRLSHFLRLVQFPLL